jgi:putative ABC transport system substrate-binding protein
MPAIYSLRVCAEVGGLVSYGITFVDMCQQVRTYAGKILKSARPADLPVTTGRQVRAGDKPQDS